MTPVAERSRRWSWSLSLIALQVACSDAAPQRYSGEAYPERRKGYESNGHILGYVTNGYSDSVSVIDLDTFSVIGHTPVGRDPVDVDGPRDIQLDQGRGLAYVILSYPLSIPGAHAVAAGATVRSGYLLELSLGNLATVGEQRIDARATGLAWSATQNQLATVHSDRDLGMVLTGVEQRRSNVAVMAAGSISQDTAVVRTVQTCVSPAGIVYAGTQPRAFIACTGEDSLVVVDTETLRILSRVPAGGLPTNKPMKIARNAAGSRLLLSNEVAWQTVVFSSEDQPTVLATTPILPGRPAAAGFVSEDRFVIAIQNADEIVLASAVTGEIIAEKPYSSQACLAPADVVQSASGRVFIVCEGSHYAPGTVVEVDLDTLEIIQSVEAELYPNHMALREP